ncbi:hypothetical protein CC80DRAFT_406524 [Byssothecium circinans]|uniref:F-box domain-containing protein n=1 Tax=Byssothecium circinans TaxID=147558 RepID=A0A6A5U7H4_9PLEO|nr:hypothetical protein CC80DRAFT_406524 [Byssothecium circinans]
MGDAALIHAFRALRTHDSRREALGALFLELSPYEWRCARELLEARTFQHDIIASLPVELVAHVFSYLDTSTPFHLQRVSRRWHTLLRSLDVVKPSLNEWYDGTLQLKDFNYTDCKQRAQNVHRFRSGGYVGLSSKVEGSMVFHTRLVEETLVGCDPSLRTLSVNNLRTGDAWQMHGDARDTISAVAASEEILAFATKSNTCYVSDLVGGQRSKFKLFANMFQALACRRRTVICGGVLPDHVEVYVWNFDTQKGSSFRVGRDQPPFGPRNSKCVTAAFSNTMIHF